MYALFSSYKLLGDFQHISYDFNTKKASVLHSNSQLNVIIRFKWMRHLNGTWKNCDENFVFKKKYSTYN